jgi:2-polyprenyl-3-methyl-5-hydroxy-6-metoxy-1,4-benzoquinol methylase
MIEDKGIIAGNVFDKYGSQNKIVQWMIKRFDATMWDLITLANPKTLHEVGCGEGFWVLRWKERGIEARGSDVSAGIIETARTNAVVKGITPMLFNVRNIYDLKAGCDNADLVVCSEVLEHLKRPDEGLQALQNVVDKYLIISVPWEPVWRLLNLIRGRYILSFGNTPGHVQHWSRRGITRCISPYFKVIDSRLCFPWIVILCRTLRSNE